MASSFLQQKAKKQAEKLEKEYGPSAYGGTTWLNEQVSGKKKKKDEDEDIAPVKKTTVTTQQEEEEDRKWFDTDVFDDGVTLKSIGKAILGTATDVAENIGAGIVGMGEKALDAIAYVSPLLAQGQFYQNGGVYQSAQTQKMFNESIEESKKWSADFIQKDLYDEEEVAKKIVLGTDANSVLGEKSDALVQSGGQLLATVGLQAAGVPWFLTTGTTSFGSQAEVALKDDAGYEEAGLSAAVSAGAEILSEKLSGGIKFGGKALDDALVKTLSRKISDKTVRTMAKFGLDAFGEGLEEVASGVFSNLGTALYKEESVGELLTSEQAMDEYLESFIGGAVLGGGSSVVGAVKANKKGVDAVSGLTANEQKVVEHEYQKRIAEEEKNGKVTERQKSKIYDEVLSEMDKGYISTDTIEEVLGGETWKTHTDTIAREKAMQEEYDTLYQMKNGDKSDAQIDRQAELKKQLDDIQQNFNRDQLGDEVLSLVQNDRLAESYNERSRRGQAFEADLTKYDAKQQATIQKAIDSGILNNTNRTHEFVDMIAKITADKGVSFDFTNNEKLKESGFAVDGKAVNGYVTKDGVTLNIESAKALNRVVGHEITHVLEGTELYQTLQNVVTEYAKAKGDYQGRYDALTKLYEGVEGADINAELTADLVGDYLFSDTDFVNHLSVTNRNMFQKMYDEIKYLCKVATAGSKEARELEKVKRVFENAYRAGSSAQSDTTKYHLSSNAKTELHKALYDTKYRSEVLLRDVSPAIMTSQKGVKNLPMAMNASHIRENVFTEEEAKNLGLRVNDSTHYHGLGEDFFLKIIDGLDNVKVAYRGTKNASDPARRENYFLLVSEFKDDAGNTVNVPVYIDEHAQVNRVFVDVNKISTVFGRDAFQDYINRQVQKGDLVRIKNKDTQSSERSALIAEGYGKDVSTEAPTTATTQNAIGDIQGTSFGDNVPQGQENVKYSLSEDSEGREISPAVQKRFGNSKVVDENGSLKVVYHGTATGEFSIFDKSKGSVEGDFGSGFYFTDNEADVSEHYEGGGPDFDNKVARLAEQIEAEEEIDYEEAEEKAREQLYKGSHKFEVYLNIENPAIVGETMLLDSESYMEQYNEEDFDDYDEYLAEVEQLVADDIENIVWEVERNVDIYSTDGIAEILWEAYADGGMGIEDLKKRLNDLYLEDSEGNLVANEVARQIIESLGYDGIIDPTVSGKWNMDIEEGTTHYIVFKPNQIKAITNQNPTDNPDIHRSLSNIGEKANANRSDVFGKDIALEAAPVSEVAPVQETVAENATVEDLFPDDLGPVADDPKQSVAMKAPVAVKAEAPTYDAQPRKGVVEGQQSFIKEEPKQTTEEERKQTRKQLHQSIVDSVKADFKAKGFDFDKVLKNAKNLSTFATVDNMPQRVMEKALGHKEGQTLSDLTVNKVAQNETEGIKWLNKQVETIKNISKQHGIKPGSKASAAAQMYAEGFYVAENNDIIAYGDAELAKDFPNVKVQQSIKRLANDPRIRRIYDDTLAMINASRTRNAYPEIPRLDNYFLHFRAMDDTFSKLGLPFNPNDIRAKDLPTDLNGVTADLKPGQPYFASAMHRRGKRTSFDLLGGLERYLNSAKNQIYHIDDIQTLRALRNYIADTYGQANGLEGLDALSEEEAQDRIEQVYNSHLSTFAKFLNEEANILAGKTALIDRGLEGIIGRRGITFLDTVNKQVGSNMVGFNLSSSLTNLEAIPRAFAKTNKFDFVKALSQTVANKLSFGHFDSFTKDSPVIIRRKGSDRFYRTPWQKAGDVGYVFMSAIDDVSTELIARTKYNELTRKGMDAQKAHYETDKWVSRLMGDRSLGQMPQLYNSKMLGLVTKFQLEVRNVLDSNFYDTIQDAKVSTEHIENGLARNAKRAAKIATTMFETAVASHLFGKAFESVAGYNPTFDIISVLMTAFGYDDDEDSEDTVLDNVEQAFLELLEDLPYTSTFTDGGRIPISSALPIGELIKGVDEWGNEKSRWKTLGEIAPYYLLPGGYNQAKKTVQGLSMFSDDHPIAGSYTDSGNLRFPVEDTMKNRVEAGIFGQWSSENARDYFDNERSPLKEKQIQEFVDVDIPIRDYWEYREGLSGLSKLEEKADYIAGLDLPIDKKNLLINNIADREEDIDLAGYENYAGFDEFDFAEKYPKKYKIAQKVGGYEAYMKYKDGMKDMKLAEKVDYIANLDLTTAQKNALVNGETDRKEPIDLTGYDTSVYSSFEEFEYSKEYPENYAVAKAVGGYDAYKSYSGELYDIKADKDENGKSISGSRKEKVLDYINNLDADYYTKIILWKSEYTSDDSYNTEIIDYLNGRDDISGEEMIAILRKLGFDVTDDGDISW